MLKGILHPPCPIHLILPTQHYQNTMVDDAIEINGSSKLCSKLTIDSFGNEGHPLIAIGKDVFTWLPITNKDLVIEIVKDVLSSPQLLGLAEMEAYILVSDRCTVHNNNLVAAFSSQASINAKKFMFKNYAPSVNSLATVMRSGSLSALTNYMMLVSRPAFLVAITGVSNEMKVGGIIVDPSLLLLLPILLLPHIE